MPEKRGSGKHSDASTGPPGAADAGRAALARPGRTFPARPAQPVTPSACRNPEPLIQRMRGDVRCSRYPPGRRPRPSRAGAGPGREPVTLAGRRGETRYRGPDVPRGRAAHQTPRAAPLARQRPGAVRGDERRPRGDGALHHPPHARGKRRAGPQDRRRVRGPRLRVLGDPDRAGRAFHRLHRPVHAAVRDALHLAIGPGDRDRLAARAPRLGSRLRKRGRPRRPGLRLRRRRADRDRVVHVGGQRAFPCGDAAYRDDARPGG
jgi:hypothetical protein